MLLGLFVGQGIGVDALAAINIAGPYVMAIIAVSMMITVGGATMCGINLGKKDIGTANEFFMTSMKLIIGLSLIVTVISFVFPIQIARLFGASDLLVVDTAIYLKYFVLFGIFFCSAMALAAFVRNDGDPKLAFWGMIFGGIANIFLDWLSSFLCIWASWVLLLLLAWVRRCFAWYCLPTSGVKRACFA